MTANKIFFDTYYPHPDKDDSGTVYIVLKDAKIYTSTTRKELFGKNLFHGCFIKSRSSDTEKEAKAEAMRLTHAIRARRVTVDEFIAIEKQQENQRLALAFAMAEKMIMEG